MSVKKRAMFQLFMKNVAPYERLKLSMHVLSS